MYEIKNKENISLHELCAIILANKLYMKNGVIKAVVTNILFSLINGSFRHNRKYTWIESGVKHSRPYIDISVIYKHSIPVGCLIIQGFSSCVFVLKEYRKQGLATALFESVSARMDIGLKLMNTGNSIPAKKLIKRFLLATTYKDLGKRSGRNVHN